MCAAPSVRLKASEEDAEVLLQHAARNGQPVGDEVISTIIATREAIAGQDVPAALEAKFWKEFAELSKSLLPATVEGIHETRIYRSGPIVSWWLRVASWFSRQQARTTTTPPQEYPPEAYVAVWRYTFVAIGVLMLVVLTQVVSGYGAMVLGNLGVLQEQRAKLQARSDELAKLPVTDLTKTSQVDQNRNEVAGIEDQEQANIELLRAFNFISTPWFDLLPSQVKLSSDPILDGERARISITALNGYLMPLLIGTLGAVAHILRTLAKQISDDSYSSEARIQLRLRLVLGPLAGAAVGLIFVDAPQAKAGGSIANIADLGFAVGPFALPFIAGYSVEFFFELADRIIGAFSTKP